MSPIKHNQTGFTLIEVMITMSLITFLAFFVIDSLGPGLAFKQRIDTERKLKELHTAVKFAYDSNPMRMESDAGTVLTLPLGVVPSSTLNEVRSCITPTQNLAALAPFLTSSAENATLDGFNQPLCLVVSNRLQRTFDGVPLNYHNIALISGGTNGVLEEGTSFNPETGILITTGDDTGTLIDGFSIQATKLKELKNRLDNIAMSYSTYFTNRFLSSPARDISVDYFANTWDTAGSIAETTGGAVPVGTALAQLGLGDLESKAPYEFIATQAGADNNDIMLNNSNGCVPPDDAPCVRSPTSGDIPPFTVILYAILPGGESSISKTVTGSY